MDAGKRMKTEIEDLKNYKLRQTRAGPVLIIKFESELCKDTGILQPRHISADTQDMLLECEFAV